MTHDGKAALRWRVAEVLKQHRPQSVRQIFYQCLSKGGIASVEKSLSGYGRVQRAVLDMRREGLIDWQHIVDGTRQTTHHGAAYNNVAHFVATYRRHYKRNLWTAGTRIEIWCESRGFEASIAALANHYRVNTVAFGGQPSDTLLFDCAERLNRSADKGQQTLVLYCGDLDAGRNDHRG